MFIEHLLYTNHCSRHWVIIQTKIPPLWSLHCCEIIRTIASSCDRLLTHSKTQPGQVAPPPESLLRKPALSSQTRSGVPWQPLCFSLTRTDCCWPHCMGVVTCAFAPQDVSSSWPGNDRPSPVGLRCPATVVKGAEVTE